MTTAKPFISNPANALKARSQGEILAIFSWTQYSPAASDSQLYVRGL